MSRTYWAECDHVLHAFPSPTAREAYTSRVDDGVCVRDVPAWEATRRRVRGREVYVDHRRGGK